MTKKNGKRKASVKPSGRRRACYINEYDDKLVHYNVGFVCTRTGFTNYFCKEHYHKYEGCCRPMDGKPIEKEVPCDMGSNNPILLHYGVTASCMRYGVAVKLCNAHRHIGTGCCTDLVEKNVKKPKSPGQSTRCNRKGNRPCPYDFEYFCAKGREYLCWMHSHSFESKCCTFENHVGGGIRNLSPMTVRAPISRKDVFSEFGEYGSEEGEGHASSYAGEFCEHGRKGSCTKESKWYCDKKNKWFCIIHHHEDQKCCVNSSSEISSAPCEKNKECKKDSSWYCSKRSKWFCDDHQHKDKECCTAYGESGGSAADEDSLLQEVQFATID